MLSRITPLVFMIFMCGSAVAQKNIPITDFNQMPMVSNPRLSPDGKNIAVITNSGDNTQVSVSPFDKPSQMTTLIKLGGEKYRIENIRWVNNQRLIVGVSQPYKLFNSQYRTNHLYSVTLDGKSLFELNKRSTRKQKPIDFYRSRPHLLSILPKDPEHILITLNDERDDHYVSVFKVNVVSGEFSKYLANTNKIVGWYVNRLGEVLMSVGIDNDDSTDFYYYYTRETENHKWKMIKKVEAFQDEVFNPLLFEAENNSIIVESDHDLYKLALWRYYINTGEYELLGEAPDGLDILGAIWERAGDQYNIVGYRYAKHFVTRVYFDGNSDQTSKQLSQLFAKSGLKATITSSDESRNRHVISALSDSKPTTYYLYDKKQSKITPWYGQFPGLNGVKLPSVTPFAFTTKDNVVLNGYITLPNNVINPPLVVFPHGGPYGVRDYQYFDPFIQLIASRGYAVLQVNYRGSGGFGNKLQTSGYGQWGKSMQTDLLEAVQWVKDNELADVDNACIAGASYGGYAALAAGHQSPKQFKCIVSIAGIGDMNALVSREKRRGGAKSFIKHAIKNSGEDMTAVSPAFHAHKFKAPVLLIHGKVDTRVSYRQSEQMYDALKEAKKDVELKLFKYGTHHLNDATNRKEAMKLMIEFIDEHLK